MLAIALLAFLHISASANDVQDKFSSYDGEYGSTRGEQFSHSDSQKEGPITAIHVRVDKYYITGFQIRYGTVWSKYVGGPSGDLKEIFLYPGESVIQMSGKYMRYLTKVVFVTNQDHYLYFGRDKGTKFNAVPLHPNAVLRFISG